MSCKPNFPIAIEAIAAPLLPVLLGSSHSAAEAFIVRVDGEILSVPYRIYCAPSDLRRVIDASTGDARRLALCLGTRHHDGHVREACLRELVTDRAWITPFIVALLGDYVIEIVELAVAVTKRSDPEALRRFVDENRRFIATVSARAASYWGCYYRGAPYRHCRDYPAVVMLRALERLACSEKPQGKFLDTQNKLLDTHNCRAQ